MNIHAGRGDFFFLLFSLLLCLMNFDQKFIFYLFGIIVITDNLQKGYKSPCMTMDNTFSVYFLYVKG